nr:hypothetical protein [Tanacetum cinerariifolium]
HSIQYKEYLDNSSNAIAATNFNQEKEEPPQNSDIRQLIREECGIKVCVEQKQNMEETMLELLEEVKNIVKQPTERGTRIAESLQNFRVKKSSTSLNNTPQIPSVNASTPVLPTEESEYSLSMGYEHLSTTPETESDKVIKSNVKNHVQIPREYEVTFDNESECDVPVYEDSSTFDVLNDHSEILSDSNNDDISSDDDAFEDIEYVEAPLLDYEVVSLEEENDVYQEEKDVPPHFLSLRSLIIPSYSDNFLPEFETFSDTEETRSGSTTAHANNSPLEYDSFCFEIEPDQGRNIDYDSEGDIHFLEELLSNDSISLPKNKSSNFDHHDDPSFPRHPSEPPDVEFFFDFEPSLGELILAMMNNIDELIEDECFDLRRGDIDVFENIEDDDYFSFIFVIQNFLPYLIYPEVSPLPLSAGSEDTIFYSGISI